MLQRVAACCSVLQYVAACCSGLHCHCVTQHLIRYPVSVIKEENQYVAACCSVLQRVSACCSVLQRVALPLRDAALGLIAESVTNEKN